MRDLHPGPHAANSRLPMIIGHRGAAAHAPENTLAGIRRAAELGAQCVEIDAKLSADGRCIVFHDNTLERTTNGRGRVAAASFAEIRGLDAGGWFNGAFRGERVPTLDEAIAEAVFLGLRLDIEIKPCPGRESETAQAVMSEATACWPHGLAPPLITSFHRQCIAIAQERAPDWPRGFLFLRVPRDWRRLAARLGCQVLGGLARRLSRRLIRHADDAGISVLAFTVNDPGKARALLSRGVGGVVTDDPGALLAATRHGR